MSDNQDPYADVYWTIDDRVGKAVQREPAPLLSRKRAEPRILDQKISHAFELFQKPCGYGAPRFAAIEADRVSELEFSTSVKGVAQMSSERILATTCGPDTGTAAPASISASR